MSEPQHQEPTDKDFMAVHIESLEADKAALLAVVRINQKIGTGKFVWKELTDALAELPEHLK